jgi:hypothetical protein
LDKTRTKIQIFFFVRITVNGVDVADSQLAMEHLCRLFNINMNAHLSRQEVEIKNKNNLIPTFYFQESNHASVGIIEVQSVERSFGKSRGSCPLFSCFISNLTSSICVHLWPAFLNFGYHYSIEKIISKIIVHLFK